MPNPLFDPEGRLRNGWKIASFALALLLLGWGLGGLLGLWFPSASMPRWLPVDWIYAGLVLGLTEIFLRFEDLPLASVGLRMDWRWGRDFLLGILGSAGLMTAIALVALAWGGFHWQRTPGVSWSAVLAGAWMFLGVALFEEFLVRGYLFQRLVDGLGPWAALGLSALFFAWAHWGNPGMTGATKAWATLNIALAALLLGLCWLKTRSLALPVGVHLGWNWAQGGLMGFGVSGTQDVKGVLTPVFHGGPSWITGGAFGLEASLPCAVLCTLAILALLCWKPRRLPGRSPRAAATWFPPPISS